MDGMPRMAKTECPECGRGNFFEIKVGDVVLESEGDKVSPHSHKLTVEIIICANPDCNNVTGKYVS